MKKKCIKKKKAPSYAFGIEQIAANIQPIGDITGNIGTAISTNANDTSKGAVAGAAFGGLGKGASMGAQLGSVAGPMGTAIGGAVGAVGGLLGGIFTGRKKRLAALKRQRQQAQTNETMAALGNQAEMEQEYWNDNGLAYSFENGGVLPNMAWVDNNEVIRDNAGNLIKVPDNKPGTDNHLINSTHLDSVLSDKLKRPGTNKTFAQEGEKLTKMTKGSKGKDRFAKASDELNKLHANQMYNTLLSEQAAVKAKKGIKPKVKGVAPAYDDGLNPDENKTVGFHNVGKNLENLNKNLSKLVSWVPSIKMPDRVELLTEDEYNNADTRTQALYRMKHKDAKGNIEFRTVNPNITASSFNYDAANDFATNVYNLSQFGNNITPNGFTAASLIVNPQAKTTVLSENDVPVDGITGETILIGENDINTSNSTGNLSNPKDTAVIGSNVATTTSGKKKRVSSTPVVTKQKTPLALTKPINTPTLPTVNKGIDLTPINAGLPKVVNRNSQLNPTNNLLSKLDFDPNIATLAAGLFAKPEYESQVYNPYAGAVNRALARRRINIEPTLAANRRSRAINNRNLANLSPNTGANLAARTQSAVSEYAQNADLYANRDNANNQYLADAANMMNNLGQQFAQNAVYTNDINARNRAAVRNARNRSIENYNKWYQNKQLMKNQMERDKALYPLLKDYLSYGIKNELLTGLDTRYGK